MSTTTNTAPALRAAAQQALETLDHDPVSLAEVAAWIPRKVAAINALRAALAQQPAAAAQQDDGEWWEQSQPTPKAAASGAQPDDFLDGLGEDGGEQKPSEVVRCTPEQALRGASEWIGAAPHGDNCFVSDHYEGDPGSQCNCGKDSLLAAIDEALEALAAAPAAQPVARVEHSPAGTYFSIEYIGGKDEDQWPAHGALLYAGAAPAAAQPWTPVSEGLPEPGEDVLICSDDPLFAGLRLVVRRIVDADRERWLLDTGIHHREVRNVTAWMKLPPEFGAAAPAGEQQP